MVIMRRLILCIVSGYQYSIPIKLLFVETNLLIYTIILLCFTITGALYVLCKKGSSKNRVRLAEVSEEKEGAGSSSYKNMV